VRLLQRGIEANGVAQLGHRFLRMRGDGERAGVVDEHARIVGAELRGWAKWVTAS